MSDKSLYEAIQRLAAERPDLRTHLVPLLQDKTASAPLGLHEVPRNIMDLLQSLRLKPVKAWDTIHGIVIDTEGGVHRRLQKDQLQKLLQHPSFRWVEPYGNDGFSFGF